jgi:hypothetical protein
MEARLNALPRSDDESWGDGYRDAVELKKPDHVHKLKRANGNRLECLCGWSIKVQDPRMAEDIISKVNGLQG